jgi:hypothetical protein
MEFHVPHNGDVDDEELYQDIASYLSEELDSPVNTEKRYEYLRFKDEDSNVYVAEVGEVLDPEDEVVVAIFEGGFFFCVCTPSKGVPGSGEMPIVVEKANVLLHRTFDA